MLLIPLTDESRPGQRGLLLSYGPKLNMSESTQTLALPRETLFHLLMNVPEGVPQGGSTSPLIRQRPAFAFMLKSNLLERGPPSSAGHPTLSCPWTGRLCSAPHSPSPPCLQSSHLISEQLITELQSWLDRNERVVRDPNVILMAPFWSGVVVIYFSAHSSNVPLKSKPSSQ